MVTARMRRLAGAPLFQPRRPGSRLGIAALGALAAAVALATVAGGARAQEFPSGGPAGAPPVEPGSGVRLVLEMRPRAEVRGASVRLSDVVAFVSGDEELWRRLEGLEVAAAPLPGQSRTLLRSTLVQRLRQARIRPEWVQWSTPVETCTVTAKAATVDRAAVARAIEAHLLSRAVEGGPELRVADLEIPADVQVVPGALDAVVNAGPPVLRPGPAVFAIDVLVDGAFARRIWVRAELSAAQPGGSAGEDAARAARAGRAAADGERALEADGRGPGGPQGDEVPEGASVVLVVRRGAVVVSVPATTLEAARVGQPVALRNALSGAVVRGVLVTPGLAVVGEAPGA